MAAIMEGDVTAACGPRGHHDPERTATRHGSGRGSVTLGGRRVPVERPRMRATDGSGELAVPSYEVFSGTEVLGRTAMERTLRVDFDPAWLPRREQHQLSPGRATSDTPVGTNIVTVEVVATAAVARFDRQLGLSPRDDGAAV
jgi:hypothetical protein